MATVDELTDAELREHFDVLTLFRGRAYAEEGRVSALRTSTTADGHTISAASVRGSEPAPYRTQVTLRRGESGLSLSSSCTCPVRTLCKHAAALSVMLVEESAAASPAEADGAWEQPLRELLTQLGDELRPDDQLPPLALEVTLETAHSTFMREPNIRVRPLRLGAREHWVKSGADWPDLLRARPGHDFPRAQLRPMRALGRELQHERGYWVAGSQSPLENFGTHVIDLLRAALAGGVTLLPGPGIKAVEVLDGPLALVSHAQRDDDGTRLTFGIEVDGRLHSGRTVLPIGRPAHSVGLLAAGTLQLGRLSQPLTPAATRLATAEAALHVPEEEADRLTALLAPLGRLLPVRSPDETVAVPEPPAPALVLTVTWRTASHAELRWEWDYAGRRYPRESEDDLGLVRDVAAEAELAATVPTELFEPTELTDGDALALAVHDLPTLRELPGVTVIEQERPDFRRTEADPEIRFDLVEPDGGADRTHTDWLDLEIVIVVDGEPVRLPDVLAALTRGEEYLVLPSGLYLATDHPAFDRLRDIVASAGRLQDERAGRLGVHSHDLGIWAELADLGAVPDQAAAWVARARALRDLTEIPRPEPTGLATALRHYQQDGFHWLAFLHQHQLGGILADDMGLGKTLQVLALITHARAQGTTEPFLVVAPTSVLPAWLGEAATHAPGLRVASVNRRTDDIAGLAATADVVVTTYAMLRLEQDRFAARSWAGLVLDEAQQLKNHQSKTYAAARRLEAPSKLAVTGTPFENRLLELWSLLSIVAPGLYPTSRSFREQVVSPVERNGDDNALQRFRRRIGPFVLRRTKELVAADLPPKQEQIVTVELSEQHRALYDAHLAKERQRILHLLDDFSENRVAILSALTRLRQLALDPALVDDTQSEVGSAKLDLLVEHLEEITAEGHQALVFSQFTTYLGRVRDRLRDEGIPTVYLDGRTRDRGAVIERFRAGEAPVFLISLKAGGTGLTLTEADYVYVLDPWWNPAAEAQAVDRAHRIGQERHVMVYRLVSGETIEEKVMELKGRKAELFAQVVDGNGAASTAIDADDIRALFTD